MSEGGGEAASTSLRLRVNGREHVLSPVGLASLADVLRVQLGLTGTKLACGMGACGACTVLVGPSPVMSCQVLAARVREEVTTVEGLEGAAAEALRAAFIAEAGFQCGYCTSGQMVACYALLAESPRLTDAELATALSGNLCRCTGYAGIIRAVRAAARRLATRDAPP